MSVVSHVNGKIISIDKTKIVIYISPSDNHEIYSPISGKITYVSITNGNWVRQYYKTIYPKTGHLSIEMDDKISFWIEVGKPKYITDTIRFDYDKDDVVKQGQIIGEIIIGSLAQMNLPPNVKLEPNIKINSIVEGGKTVLFKYDDKDEKSNHNSHLKESDGKAISNLKERCFLITVPHSFCLNDTAYMRRCDRRASSAADIFAKILSTKTDIKIFLVKSDTDRQKMDENRIQSRGDRFRNTIDKIINEYNVLWTIDIHSFPFGGFEPKYYDYLKFVILDDVINYQIKNNVLITMSLEHSIFNFNYDRYELLMGSTANDIEEKSRSLGIPSILVEVLENLNDAELYNFLNIVADKIVTNKDLKEIYE